MSMQPSASHSLTVRLEIRNQTGMLGKVTSVIGRAGADIGAVDLVHHPGGQVPQAAGEQRELQVAGVEIVRAVLVEELHQPVPVGAGVAEGAGVWLGPGVPPPVGVGVGTPVGVGVGAGVTVGVGVGVGPEIGTGSQGCGSGYGPEPESRITSKCHSQPYWADGVRPTPIALYFGLQKMSMNGDGSDI